MGDSFLKLQEMCRVSQNVCIEVYGIFITRLTPVAKMYIYSMILSFQIDFTFKMSGWLYYFLFILKGVLNHGLLRLHKHSVCIFF